MEENREDSSPGLGRRSLKPARPLSMVLEENHDDDDNKNKNNANKTADGNVFINKTIITTTATQQLSSSSSSSSSSSLSSSTNSFPHATQGNGHNHHHYHNHKQQMTNKDDDDDGDDDVDKAEQQKGTGERGPEVPERKLRRVGVSLQPPLLSFESLLNDNDNDAGSGSGCGSGSGSGSADSDPSATIHVISSPCTSTNHYPSPRSQRRLFTTTTTTTPPRKRKLSDNTLTLRKMPDANSSCGSCGEGTDSESEGDSGLYMNRLRDTATKLNLATRRPSYLKWRAKYIERQLPRDLSSSSTMSSLLPSPSEEVKAIVAEVAEDGGKLTKERKEKMDRDLKWIREQLVDLRRQDRSLAQQLLGIRKEMSSLRLAASCEEHQELLEDAQDEMEDIRELSRFVDFPLDIQSASPLRHIGVTKMNLSSRRFSTS